MADEKEAKRTAADRMTTALREAWLQLTGAISSAESEVQKRFYESLGLAPDANLTSELLARAKKNRAEFERRIDEGVKNAVQLVRAPLDREIAALKQRVEKIQEKIEAERSKRKK